MAIPPETRVPALPDPNQDPQGFLRAVKEIIEVREGTRGNAIDREVTFRDLVDAGLAAPNRAIAGKGRMPASAIVVPAGNGGAGGGIGTGVKPVMTTPPKPRDVTAVGTFGSILIAWAQPDYANHAYTEILRADIDDIGQAVVIGSSVGGQYADAVGESATKYYWVRFVSTSNVKGAASTVVMGKTALNPEFVMANLLATVWQPDTAYQQFQYVKPTVDNGMMYRCVMDGVSGSTEPAWPTAVGQKRNDGSTQWLTVEASERVPFIIGSVNGEPAVVMDTAYIGDATISTAKIKEAFLDNLTAIHGTLHFARIEHGNIFELTIGGEIRSTVFSPLNKQGFIIRAEPGRDPDTPTTREYVAEFYGDTLFSGDVRAARVLGGMIVGASFGVPSDLDNGSFEFIAEREVVADSKSVLRSDITNGWVKRTSKPNPSSSTLLPNTYIIPGRYFYRYTSGGSTVFFMTEPVTVNASTLGEPSVVRANNPVQILTFWPDYPYSRYSVAPLDAFVTGSAAKITSADLLIISANAAAPYNYNRYRHKDVSARVDFSADSMISFFIALPSVFDNGFYDAFILPYNDTYADSFKTGLSFGIKSGSRLVAKLEVTFKSSNFSAKYVKYNVDGSIKSSTNIGLTATFGAKTLALFANSQGLLLSLNIAQQVYETIIHPTDNLQRIHIAKTYIKKDSYIQLSGIEFLEPSTKGLSIEVAPLYKTSVSGLDIHANFSSAMDNDV